MRVKFDHRMLLSACNFGAMPSLPNQRVHKHGDGSQVQ